MNTGQFPEPIRSMSAEHREIETTLDELARALGDDKVRDESLAGLVKAFTDSLKAHTIREESLLFPSVRQALGDKSEALHIIDVEHCAVANLRSEFVDLVGDLGADGCWAVEQKYRLAELVRFARETLPPHIFKEDHVLYPLASQIIPGEKLADLAHARDCDRDSEGARFRED